MDIVDIWESRPKPTKNLKTYVIRGYLSNIKNITEANKDKSDFFQAV